MGRLLKKFFSLFKKKENNVLESTEDVVEFKTDAQINHARDKLQQRLIVQNDIYYKDNNHKFGDEAMIEANPLNILKLPKDKQDQFWKEVIEKNSMLFALSPEEFRKDSEVIDKVLQDEPFLFTILSPEMKENMRYQKIAYESGKDTIFSQLRDSLDTSAGLSVNEKDILRQLLFKNLSLENVRLPSISVPQRAVREARPQSPEVSERRKLLQARLNIREESLMNSSEHKGIPRLDNLPK